MVNQDKLQEYYKFVQDHGNPSDDFETLLTCSVLGLMTETGEFADYLKQHKFHSVFLSSEKKDEMILELGDIIFYWIFACIALDINPETVIQANMEKLRQRHPNGFGKR